MSIKLSIKDMDLFNLQDPTEENIAKCKEVVSVAGKILRKWQERKRQIEQKNRAQLPDQLFFDKES